MADSPPKSSVGTRNSLASSAFSASSRAPPAALVLQGEAGIGKTTLWRFGVEQAQTRGHRVLAITAASAETQLAFAGLSDLLEGARGHGLGGTISRWSR